MKLTDLIFEKKNFLPAEDCEGWKEWFWHNTRFHEEGAVGVGEVDTQHKKCSQVYPVVGLDFWCQLAHESDRAIKEYYKWGAKDKLLWRAPLVSYDHAIRCYPVKEGHMREHIDISPMDPLLLSRLYAMIIYLDDVRQGGETEFPALNYKVTPEQGKLLIFPCNQLYSHQGNSSPMDSKHIVTCFFCADIDAPHYKANQHVNQQHGALYEQYK
mgnify:FL=1|tara:strand:- start:1608 stop:2246 length:639 start_codon:yes stop_codon:yes gene_type:complete